MTCVVLKQVSSDFECVICHEVTICRCQGFSIQELPNCSVSATEVSVQLLEGGRGTSKTTGQTGHLSDFGHAANNQPRKGAKPFDTTVLVLSFLLGLLQCRPVLEEDYRPKRYCRESRLHRGGDGGSWVRRGWVRGWGERMSRTLL